MTYFVGLGMGLCCPEEEKMTTDNTVFINSNTHMSHDFEQH